MAEKILPDSPPLNLSEKEWQEISDCAQALWAALECSEEHPNEFRDLVESVRQRFERALAPINKRLDDAYHAESGE